MNHARYATSIVAKQLDSSTSKASKNFYNTTLPSDMIFTKSDASTSDEQVDKLTIELKIHYRDFIGSFIYLFIVYKSGLDFCSAQVRKLFSKS